MAGRPGKAGHGWLGRHLVPSGGDRIDTPSQIRDRSGARLRIRCVAFIVAVIVERGVHALTLRRSLFTGIARVVLVSGTIFSPHLW